MKEIKDIESLVNSRVNLFRIAFFVLLGAIAIKYWYIQIIKHNYYYKTAENNRIKLKVEVPLRGEIYDRNGVVLTNNLANYNLNLVQEELGKLKTDEVLIRISNYVNYNYKKAKNNLKKVSYRKFLPALIKSGLNFSELARVMIHRYKLPGVEIDSKPIRNYLYGKRCAHLIGYVGKLSQKDLKELKEEGYSRNSFYYKGKSGIELTFDKYLRGEPGLRYLEVNAHGRVINELKYPEPLLSIPGDKVYLTIDVELQNYIYELMKGERGAVVAMNPNNGEVLAMVSTPSYDPNIFYSEYGSSVYRVYINDQDRPLLNRAIQDAHPPGSVFKIVMATAGLEERVITPDTTFYCPGYWNLGRRVYRCWKAGGHGTVNLIDAIMQSCNVYFYNLGQRLKIDKISKYAEMFGLGKKTNIKLPYEISGLIPDKIYRMRIFKKYKRRWMPGDTVSLSIGQGEIIVTPIQALNIVNVIANGGYLYEPKIVLKIKSLKNFEDIYIKNKVKKLPISQSTIKIIRKALWKVVNGHGTAVRARLKEYDIAGKTGTAQVIRQAKRNISDSVLGEKYRDHNWFVAYGPYEDPKLSVVVFIEHGGKRGTRLKLEIAKKIFKFYFKKLGIKPSKRKKI